MEIPSLRFEPMARAVSKSCSTEQGEESLGERLARIRKARGLTQVELAERIGSLQVEISKYERDKRRPYADVLGQLADVLGVTADELLGRTDGGQEEKPLQRRFYRRLQQISMLPKRDQDALLRTIDAFVSARKH